MKLAILHHDIESTELKFKELFENKGVYVKLFDIRNAKEKDLQDYDLILNRVYSSIASRDFISLDKTLNLLKNLEKNKIKCINSFKASLADYNKFELFKLLSSKGIFTPPTLFIGSKEEIKSKSKEAEKNFGFPIVVKRNCGGKSYDVTKVYSIEELIKTLNKSFIISEKQNYKGGFVLQKFIKSIRDHDTRVGIVNGEFSFSYARSFISRNSEDKWMASTSGGSYEFDYNSNDEEKDIAIKSNWAIDSSFSESDVILSEEGPCIIEVNLTPGYFVDNEEDVKRMELIVNSLTKDLLKIKLIELKAIN